MGEFLALAEGEMLRQRRVELRALLERFTPKDLLLTDILALIAVLTPVAARVQPQTPPVALRVVR